MRDIVVVPYDPNWIADFEAESARVRHVLAPLAPEIHHIGSTSVPGLMAKPVIDMLMVVEQLSELDSFNPAMETLGYQPKGEFGIPGRRFFAKGPDASRTHHIHAFARGHGEIQRHLSFRDYLRTHPQVAGRYGQLKVELAELHPDDIEKYIAGKSGLISEILQQAQQRRSNT